MIQHPVILFDGVCNFCNGTINFIIKRDKKGVFRFAALQSETGQKLLEQFHLDKDNFETFVLIDKGTVYQKSTASLRIFNQLSWFWKWTQFFWIFPTAVRNSIYNVIAKNRYKWFGKKDQCMVPTPQLSERFLK